MTPSPQTPPAAQLRFVDVTVDQSFEIERTFSQADTLDFARISGDYSPLHVDPQYAASTEFGACVVHGMLLASLFSQLVGMRIPGTRALYLGQDLAFRRPVRVGEAVRAIARVTSKSDATRTLVLATEIRGQDGRVAVSGTAKVKVREEPAPATGEATRAPAGTVAAAGRHVALVTGASGGIGSEIARTLARRGMAVGVHYHRNADAAQAVAQAIRDAGGVAQPCQADVRDAAAIEAMIAGITTELGAPTVLVNAAIGELGQRPLAELEWSDLQQHLDFQLKAVFLLCKRVYPAMKAAGGGAIVNLLSQVNTGVPPTGVADYVAAKHALEGLSKAMAAEWSGDGVRVNMVSPGLTRTELTMFQHERIFKMEAARTPLRRLATPHDIAAAVAYLCGEESSFLTGTNIFVTGGQVML